MQIIEFFKNLANTLLDGSFDRVRIINEFNRSFKEYFYSGEMHRLCKASISMGDERYRHEMSSFVFRSGFKIKVENDLKLQNSEVEEIAHYVLAIPSFIRRLMAIGFDTLIIAGANTGTRKIYALKEYSNLEEYFIGNRS